MRKIDATLARIRLLLADVGRQETLNRTLHDQYLAQRQRILHVCLYGTVDLPTSLGLLDDLDRKLSELDRTARHLELVRRRAEQEMHSLVLTRQAEDAKARLAAISQRQAEIAAERAAGASDADPAAPPDRRAEQAELVREAAELRGLIDEASDQAARSFSRELPTNRPPADLSR